MCIRDSVCKDLELAARAMEKGGSEVQVTQTDLDKLFEKVRRVYAEADQALEVWLASAPLPR